mmetsp:Transcript_23751/g.66300  ORF Transcript_23751/g.66300 Transcript_23751/m.66300 type:complete len:224 (+) Transcript_23751:553-1224(+)
MRLVAHDRLGLKDIIRKLRHAAPLQIEADSPCAALQCADGDVQGVGGGPLMRLLARPSLGGEGGRDNTSWRNSSTRHQQTQQPCMSRNRARVIQVNRAEGLHALGQSSQVSLHAASPRADSTLPQSGSHGRPHVRGQDVLRGEPLGKQRLGGASLLTIQNESPLLMQRQPRAIGLFGSGGGDGTIRQGLGCLGAAARLGVAPSTLFEELLAVRVPGDGNLLLV